jgi:site-specific recombinase XerD
VAGVVSYAVAPTEWTALDRLIRTYHEYLQRDRCLTAARARAYCDVARRFLRAHLGQQHTDEAALSVSASDVTEFLLEAASRCANGTVANIATALRSLLRYMHLEGHLSMDLRGAVPVTTGARRGGLPKGLNSHEVRRLLRTCDRRRAVGRRDYAVLLLMVRLGMRRGEVAALELDDIDWHHGELRVRGKGNRHERLPLPADVGEAIATYLRRSRPQTTSRHVMLTVRAPTRALSAVAVAAVVDTALARAGLPTGSHRLRHTAATQMLAAGASLDEIAQVLRHQSHSTTAIYAKVDRSALTAVVRPWPGAVS